MAWAEQRLDRLIFTRIGILIADQKSDRRACGFVMEHSREDLYLIFFCSRRGIRRFPRLAMGQFPIDVLFYERQIGRTAIDDDPDGRSMGLTKCCDPKKLAKKIRCHEPIRKVEGLGIR